MECIVYRLLGPQLCVYLFTHTTEAFFVAKVRGEKEMLKKNQYHRNAGKKESLEKGNELQMLNGEEEQKNDCAESEWKQAFCGLSQIAT